LLLFTLNAMSYHLLSLGNGFNLIKLSYCHYYNSTGSVKENYWLVVVVEPTGTGVGGDGGVVFSSLVLPELSVVDVVVSDLLQP
jgi:hypothetical protein